MRINIIQHTPNEQPGSILDWAHDRNHDVYIYHPYQFGYLPKVDETDMLVIMGGPMSVNDDVDWIEFERDLIKELAQRDVPMFGACFGAQQLSKAFGGKITTSPVKEVGWAPVYLKSDVIDGIPAELTAMHWHGETFEIPDNAELLFSSELLANQGFVIGHRIVGLQFHFELQTDNVREIVTNDFNYIDGSVFKQTKEDILAREVPKENKDVMYTILDFISEGK
ncbi:type 1 glutamine amidotransferase [Apilactobacillus apinorum]|uniref:type 1 glutamine amidotransferase n=1 Tax=Apilactobacillus apinorum TaxID=1218495 RepID=UPI0030E8FF47